MTVMWAKCGFCGQSYGFGLYAHHCKQISHRAWARPAGLRDRKSRREAWLTKYFEDS